MRLAPTGFLKQNGMILREGDTISVKGFRIEGMEGDLIVASEVLKSDRSLTLCDASGQTAW
ncbi:MAG: hypothetical protein U0Q18_02450 [Bryobacteraceae bacterium]